MEQNTKEKCNKNVMKILKRMGLTIILMVMELFTTPMGLYATMVAGNKIGFMDLDTCIIKIRWT